ncbi:hypothetical protein [Dethiobacter alkaliphilus]|uniref:hypothetical protein n=1 Tax=Dethiobacter alkaliphilus TaxID=427926 RepID=UPI0022263FDA|nr:hypothetical protein [Dethiobacter alkaliphilus]MCW3490539.1 hypothetical protein [Dethiobacter alkaliphilus]
MFERFCKRLCLHTKAARIAFFSSLIFILSITIIGIVYLSETPAIPTPPVVEAFEPTDLEARFVSQFGEEQGRQLFGLVQESAAEGDYVLQSYHLLRGETALTADQARERLVDLQRNWDEAAGPLLATEDAFILAVSEDIDEAISLARGGLEGGIPFINRALSRARGKFYDLNNVLLTEDKSENYYGETRLGQLVETEALR